MAVEAATPLRALLKEALSTTRKAQALRSRLEEFLAQPQEESASAGGHAAVLAEAILGSATAQKMVELTRWVERHLEFVHTLWPIAYLQYGVPACAAPERRAASAEAPLEYETAAAATAAEDEAAAAAEGDAEARPWGRGDGEDEEEDEQLRVGVNLYLYMEDDLAAAAEGLVSMPKLANAFAEGLIACRGVNMGFCSVVAAHRETARELLLLGEAPPSQARYPAVRAQTLRALEAAAVDLCDAVRCVLRAVQRGVALMQTAMDAVESASSAKRRKTG